MKSIIMTKPDNDKFIGHLLKNPRQENIAALLCGNNKFDNDLELLVKDVLLINDGGLTVHTGASLEFSEEMYRKILLKCDELKTSLIVAHSHPFSNNAWFSSVDNKNDKIQARFITEHLPDIHYGNMVVAQKDFKARIFNKEKDIFEEIKEIKILGKFNSETITKNEPELDRNYRAFGRKGQAVISQLKIALVGCGGLGWYIGQQLVGIGVRNVLLVDYDTIEITNLNRLPGAPFSCVGEYKVKVLAELLKQMNTQVNVKYLISNVSDSGVFEELKKYDIIIGALDSERARMWLNNFSARYLKYYLDAGSGILLENGKVKHAGGQVNVIVPGESPCLACNSTLDWKMALYERMEKEEQDIEVKGGYIQGVSEPAPSVVSINGIMASALVNEFLALATGLKEPNYYTYFDYMRKDNLMFTVDTKKNENCVVCSKDALFAYGDVIEENQKSNKLPTFITEESNDTRRIIDDIKQIGSARYKPVKKNFIRTRIRTRQWYGQYI